MGIRFTGKYIGNKKLELTHLDSGAKIITSAPLDNNGDGSSFSPTDLCAVSLGTCMLTVMAIYAERKGINLGGSYFELEKHMAAEPRRIAKISVEIHLPERLTDEERKVLQRVGDGCPVTNTLEGKVEIEAVYLYDITESR